MCTIASATIVRANHVGGMRGCGGGGRVGSCGQQRVGYLRRYARLKGSLVVPEQLYNCLVAAPAKPDAPQVGQRHREKCRENRSNEMQRRGRGVERQSSVHGLRRGARLDGRDGDGVREHRREAAAAAWPAWRARRTARGMPLGLINGAREPGGGAGDGR